MFSALVTRVIAAIFSKGFGFSDDHFMVVEVAQQWINGRDDNAWLPWNGNPDTNGPSLLYPGFHYYLFLFLRQLGITAPDTKMYIVRLLHALYSLSIVWYSYKITEKLSGTEVAKRVGLMLALFWVLPMMSVRNAVEIVCIPPLLLATWQLIKADEEKRSFWFYLIAGLIAGVAFSIRFQTLFFIGGMGLVLWIQRKWIQGIWFGVGAVMCIVIIQNAIDYTIWHRPFVALQYYVRYNMANAYNYIVGPWYNYILLFSGLFIPPISFFLFYGISKSFKKYLMVILPALLFFAFHSYFPNKQERFVLPCVPFFFMAGMAGWHWVEQQSTYWKNHPKLLKGSWTFFWVVNTLLLVLLTPSSSKIARVDAMTWLYQNQPRWSHYMIEQSTAWNIVIPPLFYSDNYSVNPYVISGEKPADSVFAELKAQNLPLPEFILFAEKKDLEARIEKVKPYVKGLTYETTIESSYLDKTMAWLNPVNADLKYYIYKVEQ